MTRKVARVVIVGRDAAAWLTALALRRAFGATGVEVRVIEMPSLLRPADVYAAVPSLGGLHRLLGLSEAEILASAGGLPVLGQRFANWARSRPPFVHGYDTRRVAINDIDFLQFWVKARSAGLKIEFEDFSLAAAAAKQGRSVIEDDGSHGSSKAAPGYHLDAIGYTDLIRRRALASGVQAVAGRAGPVERSGDRIVSLTLEGGERVEGDLFIDASGSEAALVGDPAGAAFESWSHWFGCDRILAASAKALEPRPAFSQIAAFRSGWIGLYPLRDRTAIVAVYESGAVSDQEVADSLPVLTGLTLQGEAAVASFAPGSRSPWTGNCIAIGEAAVCLEPLDAVQLHMIHMGLSHLIALFPVDAEAMPEAEIYNAGFASHVRNVRNFQLTHYTLNQRFDEPFWDRARDGAIPDDLDARIRLFAARGRVDLYEDESFQEQNWMSILVGHGLIPRDYHPAVDAVPAEEQMAKVRDLLAIIAEDVRAMPGMERFASAPDGVAPRRDR